MAAREVIHFPFQLQLAALLQFLVRSPPERHSQHRRSLSSKKGAFAQLQELPVGYKPC
jgi:hypothetical protein